MRLYLENTQHKNRAGGVVQGEDPEFTAKKKKSNPKFPGILVPFM
jgi:hypothetical protein